MKKSFGVVSFILLLCFPMACRDEAAKADLEKPAAQTKVGEQAMKTIRMEQMTWPDIKRAIESGFTTAVFAVGSTEQHGPHLPTMTDARLGDDLAERVARKLGHALQARTIEVGLSEHHMAFAGTISLKPETLLLTLRDYVESLARHGFTRIAVIPIHGGNFATVQQAIEEARKGHPGIDVTGFTDMPGLIDILSRMSAQYGISADESGGHAGESETSMMMALEGGLVAVDRFAPGYLGPFGEAESKLMMEKGMSAISTNGVLGDPRKASAEKGEVYLERLADFLASKIGPKTTE
ncbi:MAG: creatininase family protein [Candidatus Aminicenantes bacterium]|nr:creatininase family protein [Candidatus Aminicenantes bacterium]